MTITWFGLGCVRLQSKYAGVESSTLIDPFDEKEAGIKVPRRAHADILIDLHKTDAAEGKFLIEGPGEFEVGGTFVWGIPLGGEKQDHVVYKIEAEDMIILHTGALSRVPDDSEMQGIENVDVLMVPIGGHGVLDAKGAAELVTRIEPRIVIPIWYKVPGIKKELDGPEAFLKAMGATNVTPEPKIKLSKKDLPTDKISVLLLSLDAA